MTARTPELQWCHRSAAGDLTGVHWVDVDLDPARGHWETTPDGERFHGVTLAQYLPAELTRAARAAQRRGDATALEGLELLFGRLFWLVRNRPRLWTELSPVPALLTQLVESHGVEPLVHAGDPERLARLAARLHGWRKRRGELLPTLELLEEGAGILADERYQQPGQAARAPAQLADEVFACHAERWWRARAQDGAQLQLRIDGGYLRFQDPEQPGFALLREDVMVVADADKQWTRAVVRLLAGWTSLRPVLREERS